MVIVDNTYREKDIYVGSSTLSSSSATSGDKDPKRTNVAERRRMERNEKELMISYRPCVVYV